MEGSICNAYLVEETSNFCSHYFEPHVYTRMHKVPRNDDGGDGDEIEGTLSIFKHHDRPLDDQNLSGYLIVSMRLHELMFC